MHLIAFYVPESHLETVKNALFAKGAGRIGNYDCCAWQTKGVGQFRPLGASTPFLGEVDVLHTTKEFKVEMVCSDNNLIDILQELVKIHPYEEPAYHAVKIKTLSHELIPSI